MNRFTKVKMSIVSFFLLVLTACGYNNAANDNNQNENQDRSAGIHSVNNGVITDEHEPYRTSMSSDTYPHTSSVQNTDGQRKYFKFIQKKIVVNPGQNGNWQTGQSSPANPNPGNYQNITPGGNLTGDTTNNTANRGNTGNTGNNVTPPTTQQPPAATPAPAPTEQQKAPTQNQGAAGISSIESKVIELTNQQRAKNGLPALKADTSLSKVARTKSNDMRQKNYFSHTSPTYGSPFDMMRDFGVTYKTAGENIAKGQQSAEAVVNAWMNSEGHRKNILSSNFTHIGVGHDSNGNYWTQMFIGK